jgi:hypothetical protein
VRDGRLQAHEEYTRSADLDILVREVLRLGRELSQ